MELYSIIRSARWWSINYPADRYAQILRASERWSRKDLEYYRNEKLRRLIAHCYENVPYYRTVMRERNLTPEDISSAEDLPKLPILTKDLIRQNRRSLMANNAGGMKVSWTRTGGTTGEPMEVCKNIECKAWESMCYERGLRWGGKRLSEPVVRLMSADRRSRVSSLLRRDWFIPAFQLSGDNVRSYIETMRRRKYRFIIGYPSAVYRLARLSEEMREELSFTAAFVTGELMLPEWEKVIRNVFKCNVLPYYGCGEVNSLGFSTPDLSGYVIPEEHAIIEIMQSDKSTVCYGEGRFIVTDLDNYAMPIIRYANGDAGSISEPHDDRPYSRIKRLDGRFNSFLMTDRGDLISGMAATYIFRQTSRLVKSYRVIQEEPLRVVIKIVPDGDLMQDDERIILTLFTRYLGARMKITIEKVARLPEIPSGKSVFVINYCLQ